MSVRRQGVAEAPRPLRTMYATGSYFSTLGVGPFIGRVFTAEDDRAAATPVTVMAYHTWQGVYGGDASVVGSTLMIEGQAFTVARIAPAGFFGETMRAIPNDHPASTTTPRSSANTPAKPLTCSGHSGCHCVFTARFRSRIRGVDLARGEQ